MPLAGRLDFLDKGWMLGMTRKGINQYPTLKLIYGCCAAGLVLCTGYIIRCCVRSPDCCWDKTNNPYPWQKYAVNGQYKFLDINQNYKSLKAPEERPDID